MSKTIWEEIIEWWIESKTCYQEIKDKYDGD